MSMTDALTFRNAAAEDCTAVYDMICDMEAKELPYSAFEKIFAELLKDRHHEFILGGLDSTVVSVLHLRYENQLHHAGRIAEIMEFVVKDGHRNKGIGKEMLKFAVRRAEEQGCLQLEVACNQLREDTHRFYLREGMKNYHYKFSKGLNGFDFTENALGR